MARKKRSSTDPPEPWERQPGEGPQAFAAFAAYRDSGAGGEKRSLSKTAQKLLKSDGTPYSTGTLREWSRKWKWQDRVDAYDAYMDEVNCENLKKGITDMRMTHVKIAKAMLVKALEGLKSLPAHELTSRDIATMVDVAAKLERISRGEATERTEGKQTVAGEVSLGSIDLSKITDQELNTLDELTRKISTGESPEH